MMLTIPFPPSVNRLWRQFAGRTILSKDGRDYRAAVEAACWDNWSQGVGAAQCAVTIRAFVPDARRRDLDNLLKAALDGLTAARQWDDDSQIKRLTIEHCGIDRASPRLEVVIEKTDER